MTIRAKLRESRWLRCMYRVLVIQFRTKRRAPAQAQLEVGSKIISLVGGTWATANTLDRHSHGGELNYEPDETAIFAELARSADVIFDIGAQIGYYSVLGAVLNPEARVYAFEMMGAFAREIRRHAVSNGVAERITVVTAPVGRDGIEVFYEAFIGRRRSVSISLDSFCEARAIGPQLVKMDIEGYEYLALPAAQCMLIRYRPTIILGFHPTMIEELGGDPSDVFRLLHRLHYNVALIDADSAAPRPITEAPQALCNLLCTPCNIPRD